MNKMKVAKFKAMSFFPLQPSCVHILTENEYFWSWFKFSFCPSNFLL